MGRRVCLAARRYGAILRPLGDVLVFMPPLAMSEAEICAVVSAAGAALRDLE
jgi:adenosylmethionine-8-amino-7-oxononanoate aminotransferase